MKSEVAQVPRLLMLEVNNARNLKCVMCNNRKIHRPKGTMPVELGISALNEAADFRIKEVALFTVGEPLIYKHLEVLFKEAKQLLINLYGDNYDCYSQI